MESTSGNVAKSGTVNVRNGDLVPSLDLPSTSGRFVNLAAEAKQRHLVLFFYPGDTVGQRYEQLAGCTLEARAFRDAFCELQGLDVAVFGINLQTPERQRQFVDREHLPFELLSDSSKRLVALWGIPLWTSRSGEEYVSRVTIIVRKGGVVAEINEVDSVPEHISAVLAQSRSLRAPSTGE